MLIRHAVWQHLYNDEQQSGSKSENVLVLGNEDWPSGFKILKFNPETNQSEFRTVPSGELTFISDTIKEIKDNTTAQIQEMKIKLKRANIRSGT